MTHAKHEAQQDPDETNGEADPSTRQDAREHIASQPVRPKEEYLAILYTEEVEIHLPKTPKHVRLTAVKEDDFVYLGEIIFIDSLELNRIQLRSDPIDERTLEIAFAIPKVDSRGR